MLIVEVICAGIVPLIESMALGRTKFLIMSSTSSYTKPGQLWQLRWMPKLWGLRSRLNVGIEIIGTYPVPVDDEVTLRLIPSETEKGPSADISPETDTGTTTTFYSQWKLAENPRVMSSIEIPS